MREGGTPDRPATFFDDAADFRAWLEEHHDTADGLWVGLNRSHVQPRGPRVPDLVPEALCFGWIDSHQQPIDADTLRLRFTPRRKGSIWSRVNIARVEQLIAEGRMQPAGLAAYEQRKLDNTGLYSYEQDEEAWPPEFDARLRADERAAAFWDRAAASYRKMCVHWVLSAKREETRDRRMGQLLDACRELRLISPQSYGDEPAWLRRLRTELG